MQHTDTRLKVFLGLGDDPGKNYNITLRPMFAQEGLGNFCLGKLNINEVDDVKVKDGTNATIQVISSGDPKGGLYQCADVVLVERVISPSDYNQHCTNGTGIKITAENMPGNPNETTTDSDGPTKTAEATATATATAGASERYNALGWTLSVVAAAGIMML